MAEIETLTRKRGSSKAAITNFKKFLESLEVQQELSKAEFLQLQDRVARVEKAFSGFQEIQFEIEVCPEFTSINLEERPDFVKKSTLCANCLRWGHNARQCKLGPCKKCKAWHNSLLHVEKENSSDKNHVSSKSDTQELDTTYTSSISSTGSGNVFLSTALVKIFSKSGP